MTMPAPSKRLVVIRRVIELLLPSVLFSVLLAILNVAGIIVQRYHLVLAILICVILFTGFNVSNLRKCFCDMHHRKLYYLLNLLSHIIFALINVFCYMIMSDKVYAWTFSITKLITYLDVDTWYSILIFHAIGLITVFAATIGMNWIFMQNDADS